MLHAEIEAVCSLSQALEFFLAFDFNVIVSNLCSMEMSSGHHCDNRSSVISLYTERIGLWL